MKRLRGFIIFVALIGGCFGTEYISRSRVNPTGRISNLNDYLAWRPSDQEFATVDVNGKQHVIAYGPVSSWLMLSSGPTAFVFDDTGALVDWSYDIGDHPAFDQRWEAQRSRGLRPISRDAVQAMSMSKVS